MFLTETESTARTTKRYDYVYVMRFDTTMKNGKWEIQIESDFQRWRAVIGPRISQRVRNLKQSMPLIGCFVVDDMYSQSLPPVGCFLCCLQVHPSRILYSCITRLRIFSLLGTCTITMTLPLVGHAVGSAHSYESYKCSLPPPDTAKIQKSRRQQRPHRPLPSSHSSHISFCLHSTLSHTISCRYTHSISVVIPQWLQLFSSKIV